MADTKTAQVNAEFAEANAAEEEEDQIIQAALEIMGRRVAEQRAAEQPVAKPFSPGWLVPRLIEFGMFQAGDFVKVDDTPPEEDGSLSG